MFVFRVVSMELLHKACRVGKRDPRGMFTQKGSRFWLLLVVSLDFKSYRAADRASMTIHSDRSQVFLASATKSIAVQRRRPDRGQAKQGMDGHRKEGTEND